MKEHGYTVSIPDKRLFDVFLEENLVNSPKWLPEEKFNGILVSNKTYSSWFKALSDEIKNDVRRE
jgi:cobalamin biosynthesis Mg chelatase CobN